MAKERTKFVEGAKRVNNIEEKTANSIFDILDKFAGYGFNKSHSAAYAILSYQTGFLKANYPVQFMAAMLSSELGNSEKVSHFVAECEAMGLKVLGARRERIPRDVHARRRQNPLFRPRRRKRRGRELAAQKIIAERDAKGPFPLPSRVFHLPRRRSRHRRGAVLEHLSKTGAFDFSGALRRKIFDSIDGAMATAANNARDKAAGQHSFMDMLAEPAPAKKLPPLPPSRDRLLRARLRRHRRLHLRRAPHFREGTPRLLRFRPPDERLRRHHRCGGYLRRGRPAQAGRPRRVPHRRHRQQHRQAPLEKDNRPWAMSTLATKTPRSRSISSPTVMPTTGAILAENAPILVLGNIMTGTEGPRINVKEC